jgi:hypothetical protein
MRAAHLFAASGFAFAQPLFDLLGKNPEFFAVRGSTPGDIVLFALAVTSVLGARRLRRSRRTPRRRWSSCSSTSSR